jgi:O-antigen/teichoic acid export membrane protein
MNPIRTRIEGARRTLQEDGKLRAILKHTGWLTGSNASIIALSAVQGILTARILGVAVWGALGIALSFATVINLLLSFRTHEFVVKWVTQFNGDGTSRAASAFRLALIGDVGSALLSLAIVVLLAGWGASVFARNPQFTWLFQSAGLIVALQAGQETLMGIMHLNRDFRLQGLVQTFAQAVSVVGVAVVYLKGGGIFGVVVVLVGTAALTAVLMWTLGLRAASAVLKRGWMFQKLVRFGELGREMWRFAIFGNFRGTAVSVMGYGDLLVLGFLRNPTEVGYYKLAKAIAGIANLPNVPLVNATFPELSEAAATESWGEFRSLIRRGSKVAALWMLPVSLGLLILARPAIALLYGPAFLPAAPALAILLVGVIVDGVLFWGGIALLSLGKPGYLLGVNLWVTSAKYALAFLLVPVGGYLALAALQSLAVVSMNALSSTRTLMSLRDKEASAHG